ncbi:class I SAM-dependent DNA methyltransferase [Palleronia sp. LCG004]|uniref:class I SAM-dependent DNA methyltransferase n=1 Tax=Palleronia sp. LCG004 TaxID=3079304 RepID=UPI002943B91D|nr:DNA methyltransferase [Palleronia sp. LCG004]WOI56729.1 type IIL restriction-modification enzyme MmeI [Palleronia sp. LCG004]
MGRRVLQVEDFITRWRASGGSEIANFQTFASELCDILGVDRPKPAQSDGQTNDYRFERPVTETHTGTRRRRRIDLYRRQCFVMEAKQGAGPKAESEQLSLLSAEDAPQGQLGHGRRGTRGFEDTMLRARNQADGYARAISKEDGWPPFLLVVDVAHVIEVYADFSGQGQGYTQFPDGNRYRITLEDLRDDEVRERLKTIWSDPISLDPSRTAARVTREIADHLAQLGRSFEGQGHEGEDVARFLMRCLFTMFAEDVELLPKDSFRDKLRELRGKPEMAAPVLQSLWETMNTGGTSTVLMAKLLRFNGGLFRDASALPLSEVQLSLLIEAAEADWKQVEPAIFGTLLERALDKKSRHKLGAHYTPRAYVERLVMPTIIEPLRADWRSVQAAADLLRSQGKDKEALREVQSFHRKLCEVTVLDPACGSGNFLYVALELMKRLEGEVVATMEELGETQANLGLAGYTVDPHQFLGIELNPWAANVAELVLWIGYLQWHYRTHGKAAPSEPILRDFKNIEHRDAVLTWTDRTPRMDDNGAPVTRWDGTTTMRHPATGEEVPDPAARMQIYDYADPRPAVWPEATFIVGNPPFIGASRMREALGDGYVEALWNAYPKMPQSADLVMFWWEKAALKARAFDGQTGLRRFGLITTNSLRQTFNRRVLEPHLGDSKRPLSLLFAIPDHPWVDTVDGAAVRIGMTVAAAGSRPGRLVTVVSESGERNEAEGRQVELKAEMGLVFSNLRIGADVGGTNALLANDGLSSPGMKLHGAGFIVSPPQAEALGLGSSPGLERHIRPYRNGRDLTASPRGVMVIDLFGLSEQDVRTQYPAVFQHVIDNVKPERDQNRRDGYRKNWWIFGEARRAMRPALEGLTRYVATVETTKHRSFQFLEADVIPDNMLIAISLDDAAALATLSSRIHVTWALAAGGRLGVGNDPRYNKSRCFDPFPFPDLTPSQRTTLRQLGEELDAHRKERQAQHPKLTLTQMYNVLEKLRAGEVIEGKDKQVYEDGLVGLLKDIHDRIDAAVTAAYGWPADLSENDILMNLVALNHERAAEEARGHVRWLRPDYQNPDGRAAEAKQGKLEIAAAAKTGKAPWPKSLPAQIAAVREALEDLGEADAETVARTFTRGRATTVAPLLETLAGLGMAEMTDEGRYAI